MFEHHAYYVKGGELAAQALAALLEQQGFKTAGNPDYHIEHFETFGIDESRRQRERDSRAAVSGKKVFIISCDSITREAQNALLKTFEEPLGESHYFLCIRNTDELLPTLKSRMLPYQVDFKETGSEEAETFLQMKIDERLFFAAEFADDIKKGKRTKKDAEVFFDMLEKCLFKNRLDMDSRKIKDFLELKPYIGIKGSSVKNLMETVATII